MSKGIEMLDFEFSLFDNDYYTNIDLWFSVAGNLYLIDPSLVPSAWDYYPSILGVSLETYTDTTIREFVLNGDVTANDLIAVGNMLAKIVEQQRPEGE